MTTQSTKVRLVRCPKCELVLVELPNLNIYRCGGCDTILQAKNQKIEIDHSEVTSQIGNSTAETPTRSSNANLNGPTLDESSLDKDDIRYRDAYLESCSELSEYMSVSNELACAAEANFCETIGSPVGDSLNDDKEKFPFGQASERYDCELRDSDRDSTGESNFSGEFPSSGELVYQENKELIPKDIKYVEEDLDSFLDQPIEIEQSEGTESLRVSQVDDNVQDFPEYEEQGNGLLTIAKEHPEEIINKYVCLDSNDAGEETAASINHNVTSTCNEETSLAKDDIRSENEHAKHSVEVSEDSSALDGLPSSPEFNCSESKFSLVEESSNHEKGNYACCQTLEIPNIKVHGSNRNIIEVQNFTAEIPSSSELYHDTKELTPEASECVEDDKSYLDQPTKVDQLKGGNFLHSSKSMFEQVDQLSPIRAHLSTDGVFEEEATSSIKSPKEELPPQEKGSSACLDKNMECSTEALVDGSVSSNGLSDWHEGKSLEDECSLVEKSTNHDISKCPEERNFSSYDNELLEPDGELTAVRDVSSNVLLYLETKELKDEANECVDEDAKSSLDELTKMSQTNCGIPLGVPQTNASILNEVQNFSDQENGLPLVVSNHEGADHTFAHVEIVGVSEDSKSSNVSIRPKDELLLDKSEERHQGEHVKGITEPFGDGHAENGLSSSNDANLSGNTDSHLKEYSNDIQASCSLRKDFIRYGDFEDIDVESTGIRGLSAELHSSNEFVQHETEEIKILPTVGVEQGEKSYLEHSARGEQSDCEKSLKVSQESDALLHVSGNSPEHGCLKDRLPPVGHENRRELKIDGGDLENNEKSQDRFTDQKVSFYKGIQLAGDSLSSKTVSHQNGNVSQSKENTLEVNRALEVPPTFKLLDTGKKFDPSDGGANIAPQNTLMGTLASVNILSADDKYQDYSPSTTSPDFGNANSVKPLRSSAVADTSHQFGVKDGAPNFSSISRGYYTYDSSESSIDDAENQIPLRIPLPSRRKGKEVDGFSTVVTQKRDGFRVKNLVNSELEMSLAAPLSTSGMHENHYTMRGNHRNQMEFADTRRHTQSSGYTVALSEGTNLQSPFSSREHSLNNRNRDPPIYRPLLRSSYTNFYSSDKPMFREPDKMNLLRTVCELKDQLNRIQFPRISKNGSFYSGNFEANTAPFYYDHITSERETNRELNRPSYYSRHSRERGWVDQPNVSRLAFSQEQGCVDQSNISSLDFSEEAPYYRHRVNCSCSHCRSQNWHSAQMAPRSLHYKNGHFEPLTAHPRSNMFSSSSPQQYIYSELADIKLENNRHGGREIKRRHLMEKYHSSKKLLHPVAGGSPFVFCYHCSGLLLLPADFLLFKKTYHLLRCHACSKVLKFLLLEGMHIVPCLADRPSSDNDNFSDATNQRNQVPAPHPNSLLRGESISLSDEYGRTFGRSYSTEAEASVMKSSSGLIEQNSYNRNMSYVSSLESPQNRKLKFILKESTENKKISNDPSERRTSSGLPKSINTSMEIEELPASSNSPLHLLMGYETPSEVLNK